jgi:hypothetical protein
VTDKRLVVEIEPGIAKMGTVDGVRPSEQCGG